MTRPSSHTLTPATARPGLVSVVLLGSVLFVILYIIAAWCYPGGSNANTKAIGFDLYTNYWCDLLGDYAKNGQPNPAQPVAMIAMVILCLTLGYFWSVTPRLLGYSKRSRLILQMAGVLSMAIAPFIFTIYHDTVINAAGVLGVIAMLGTLVGLYKHQCTILLQFGLLCITLCGLNNYVYYTQHFIEQLPIIQKISFLAILIWFNLVSLTLQRNAFIHE